MYTRDHHCCCFATGYNMMRSALQTDIVAGSWEEGGAQKHGRLKQEWDLAGIKCSRQGNIACYPSEDGADVLTRTNIATRSERMPRWKCRCCNVWQQAQDVNVYWSMSYISLEECALQWEANFDVKAINDVMLQAQQVVLDRSHPHSTLAALVTGVKANLFSKGQASGFWSTLVCLNN